MLSFVIIIYYYHLLLLFIIVCFLGVRHNRLPDLQATKVKATLYSATKL